MFDEEDRRRREMEDRDTKLALSLSLGHDISGSSEDENDEHSPSKKKKPTKSSCNDQASSSQSILHGTYKIPKTNAESKTSPNDEKSDNLQKSMTVKHDPRPRCEYGRKCYRKNPVHQQEFYHSESDSDEGSSHTKAKKRKINMDDSGQSAKKKKGSDNATTSTVIDALQATEPFSFLMSKVTGISPKFNNKAVDISEILSPAMGELEASVQFNYCHDISWLMRQYHPKFRSKPLLLVHGEKQDSKNALHEEASAYPNIRLCQARLEIMYGTHHSKMMILLYQDGLRVVIHTANLVESDWHQKSQGVWISPLFPKLKHDTPTAQMGNSITNFKVDLLEYIAAYKTKGLTQWQEHLLQHDMTEARVYIIASVPGRHQGESKTKWGHMKFRKLLKEHANTEAKNWSVVGQFSSVGSLGPDKNKWLCSEWLESLSTTPKGTTSNPSLLKLIFPSVDNVRVSLEGYPAGSSIPYSSRTAVKQQYFNTFLHQWSSSVRGRSRASPHIKTYARVSPDQSKISWFLVTSANLSKAAWGALEKKNTQLMIRSYEIGVLFLPKNFNQNGSGHFSVDDTESSQHCLHFPLPWDLPLKPYQPNDSPWIWDIAHAEKPDSHGNAWIPS
ncbi:tyrosyl-DNA phosphodiesterase 1-like isoform X2 [Antedon mediterranea]|uniref:tyrosyl-DNA phosphodiesterase 1-like isoform X2 n=1 Tax=Antedon mediterranea TaxID=105859 RepID=UPI003AF7540A